MGKFENRFGCVIDICIKLVYISGSLILNFLTREKISWISLDLQYFCLYFLKNIWFP